MKALVVVNMQNDFITGPLGNAEARAIVPKVIEKVAAFDGMVIAVRNTHTENYHQTQEGRQIPVMHCVRDTEGWKIVPEIEKLLVMPPFESASIGCPALGRMLDDYNRFVPITEITVVGLATSVNILTNALMLKSFLPETKIIVDASCCAGLSVKEHDLALTLMRASQIYIENDTI